MDLTIAVNGDDAHRCPRLLIASDRCRSRSDLARIDSLAERRPAEAVVVLRVQVGDDVDHRVHDTIVDGTSIQSGRARSASDSALTRRSVLQAGDHRQCRQQAHWPMFGRVVRSGDAECASDPTDSGAHA